MNNTNKQHLVLLLMGAGVMSLSLILKRYDAVTDLYYGLLQGAAIGLMILSLIRRISYQKARAR